MIVTVYRGPTITAAEVSLLLPAARVLGPVRHGDLLRLGARPGDEVIIIDGVFHQDAAVRHKEILSLLAAGVRVTGTASMGALRAAELGAFGMTGTGTVYEAYRDGVITADDEVAVAHTPGDYRPLSDAMVDITAVTAAAAAAGAVTAAEAAAVTGAARAMHYPDRSWAALRRLGPAARRADDWRCAAGEPGAKLRDAREALTLAAAGQLPAAPPAGWARRPWRNMYLRDWQARFGEVTTAGGVRVPVEQVMRYSQIYEPGFPARWRRHVLTWIAGGPGPRLGERAAAAARRDGITAADLAPAQARYWLTAAEMTLPDREKLTRILVRAVPGDLTAAIWPVTAGEAEQILGPLGGAAAAVASAVACNSRVLDTAGPEFATWLLREDLIVAHLARQWGVDGGDGETVTAAARDRGFGSLAGAADAARVFYLAGEGMAVAGVRS
jgi:hypothetical protein